MGTLEQVPGDIVIAVMHLLDVADILRLRRVWFPLLFCSAPLTYSLVTPDQVCKFLYDLSQLRVVWLSAFMAFRVHKPHLTPPLPQPLNEMTTAGLETYMTQLRHRDHSWRLGLSRVAASREYNPRIVGAAQMSRTTLLILGGRWLVYASTNTHDVIAVDLDTRDMAEHRLIDGHRVPGFNRWIGLAPCWQAAEETLAFDLVTMRNGSSPCSEM